MRPAGAANPGRLGESLAGSGLRGKRLSTCCSSCSVMGAVSLTLTVRLTTVGETALLVVRSMMVGETSLSTVRSMVLSMNGELIVLWKEEGEDVEDMRR